jgi:putative flippase GtrA
MTRFEKLRQLPLLGRLLRHRFIKFGIVGASGTLVNVAVLYLAQETLLVAISPPSLRLNLSLAVAIFFATINNFLLNRAWTWLDRRPHVHTPILLQFSQYTIGAAVHADARFRQLPALSAGKRAGDHHRQHRQLRAQ